MKGEATEGGREGSGRDSREKKKRKSEESGDVGKQINSSVGSSRVFSGEAPNICFGRSCLIRAQDVYIPATGV